MFHVELVSCDSRSVALDPLDIVNCIRAWIESDMDSVSPSKDEDVTVSVFPQIKPWYRGFKGTIEKDTDKNRYISTGVCSRSETKKDQAIVTEIPIGMSIQDFKEKLETLRDDKTIKDFRNLSGANFPYFIIEEFTDKLKCTAENLKLQTYISVNNMIAFDEQNKIKKYDCVDDILNDFCYVRLKYYTLRKARMIKDIEKKIRIMKGKKRFITEILDKSLEINDREED